MSPQSLSCTKGHVTMFTLEISDVAMDQHVLVQGSFSFKSTATSIFRTYIFQAQVL
eukprot:05820.XXX_72317_72484_1 [CDS] Oithona nana genome sequencing.